MIDTNIGADTSAVVACSLSEQELAQRSLEAAHVQRVSDRDPERLRYLEQLGIRPGVAIRVLEALPFEGPLRLEVSGVEQMIGRPLAAVVQVAPTERAA